MATLRQSLAAAFFVYFINELTEKKQRHSTKYKGDGACLLVLFSSLGGTRTIARKVPLDPAEAKSARSRSVTVGVGAASRALIIMGTSVGATKSKIKQKQKQEADQSE